MRVLLSVLSWREEAFPLTLHTRLLPALVVRASENETSEAYCSLYRGVMEQTRGPTRPPIEEETFDSSLSSRFLSQPKMHTSGIECFDGDLAPL